MGRGVKRQPKRKASAPAGVPFAQVRARAEAEWRRQCQASHSEEQEQEAAEEERADARVAGLACIQELEARAGTETRLDAQSGAIRQFARDVVAGSSGAGVATGGEEELRGASAMLLLMAMDYEAHAVQRALLLAVEAVLSKAEQAARLADDVSHVLLRSVVHWAAAVQDPSAVAGRGRCSHRSSSNSQHFLQFVRNVLGYPPAAALFADATGLACDSVASLESANGRLGAVLRAVATIIERCTAQALGDDAYDNNAEHTSTQQGENDARELSQDLRVNETTGFQATCADAAHVFASLIGHVRDGKRSLCVQDVAGARTLRSVTLPLSRLLATGRLLRDTAAHCGNAVATALQIVTRTLTAGAPQLRYAELAKDAILVLAKHPDAPNLDENRDDASDNVTVLAVCNDCRRDALRLFAAAAEHVSSSATSCARIDFLHGIVAVERNDVFLIPDEGGRAHDMALDTPPPPLFLTAYLQVILQEAETPSTAKRQRAAQSLRAWFASVQAINAEFETTSGPRPELHGYPLDAWCAHLTVEMDARILPFVFRSWDDANNNAMVGNHLDRVFAAQLAARRSLARLRGTTKDANTCLVADLPEEEWVNLLSQFLEQRPNRRGKYAALCNTLPHTGGHLALRVAPNLIRDLLRAASSIPDVSNVAAQAFGVLLSSLKEETVLEDARADVEGAAVAQAASAASSASISAKEIQNETASAASSSSSAASATPLMDVRRNKNRRTKKSNREKKRAEQAEALQAEEERQKRVCARMRPLWLDPLVEVLCTGSRGDAARGVERFLPLLFNADPFCVPPLLDAIRVFIPRSAAKGTMQQQQQQVQRRWPRPERRQLPAAVERRYISDDAKLHVSATSTDGGAISRAVLDRRMWVLVTLVSIARHSQLSTGVVIVDDGSSAGIRASEVEAAALHPKQHIRISALELLRGAAHAKSPLTATEIALMKRTLPYSLNTVEPGEVHRLKQIVRTFLQRMCMLARDAGRDARQWLGYISQLRAQRSQPPETETEETRASEALTQALRKLGETLSLFWWFSRLALGSLYPSAPFGREVVGLELLRLLTAEVPRELPVIPRNVLEELAVVAPPLLVGPRMAEATAQMTLQSILQAAPSPSTSPRPSPAPSSAPSPSPSPALSSGTLAGGEGSESESDRQLTLAVFLHLAFTDAATPTICLLESSWTASRELARSVLLALPRPLPGYTSPSSAVSLVRAGLQLSASPRANESAAGAILLEVVFRVYVQTLCYTFAPDRLLQPSDAAGAVGEDVDDDLVTIASSSAVAQVRFLEMVVRLVAHRLHMLASAVDRIVTVGSSTDYAYPADKPTGDQAGSLQEHGDNSGSSTTTNNRNKNVVLLHGLMATFAAVVRSIDFASVPSQEFPAFQRVVQQFIPQLTQAFEVGMQVIGEHKYGRPKPGGGDDGGADEEDRSRVQVDCRGHAVMGPGGDADDMVMQGDADDDVARMVLENNSGDNVQYVVMGSWLLFREGADCVASILSHISLPILVTDRGEASRKIQEHSSSRPPEQQKGRDQELSDEQLHRMLVHAGDAQTMVETLLAPWIGADSSDQCVLSAVQVGVLAHKLLHALLFLKHGGAIETTRAAFQTVANRLLQLGASHPGLSRLPVYWTRLLLLRLHSAQQQFVLRRSAGFAFCFLALLRAEPTSAPPALLPLVVQDLLRAAKPTLGDDGRGVGGAGVPEGNTEGEPDASRWQSRVHALNILRLIFLNAAFAHTVLPFVSEGLQIAILGFVDPAWAVRNSSMMVFTAIIKRAVDVRANAHMSRQASKGFAEMERSRSAGASTGLGYRHGIGEAGIGFTGKNSNQLFNAYPELFPFLLRHLTAAAVGPDGKAPAPNARHQVQHESHPMLFPLLLLLTRLVPARADAEAIQAALLCDDDADTTVEQHSTILPDSRCLCQMSRFVPLVRACHSSSFARVRLVSASALAALAPMPTLARSVRAVLDRVLCRVAGVDQAVRMARGSGDGVPAHTHAPPPPPPPPPASSSSSSSSSSSAAAAAAAAAARQLFAEAGQRALDRNHVVDNNHVHGLLLQGQAMLRRLILPAGCSGGGSDDDSGSGGSGGDSSSSNSSRDEQHTKGDSGGLWTAIAAPCREAVQLVLPVACQPDFVLLLVPQSSIAPSVATAACELLVELRSVLDQLLQFTSSQETEAANASASTEQMEEWQHMHRLLSHLLLQCATHVLQPFVGELSMPSKSSPGGTQDALAALYTRTPGAAILVRWSTEVLVSHASAPEQMHADRGGRARSLISRLLGSEVVEMREGCLQSMLVRATTATAVLDTDGTVHDKGFLVWLLETALHHVDRERYQPLNSMVLDVCKLLAGALLSPISGGSSGGGAAAAESAVADPSVVVATVLDTAWANLFGTLPVISSEGGTMDFAEACQTDRAVRTLELLGFAVRGKLQHLLLAATASQGFDATADSSIQDLKQWCHVVEVGTRDGVALSVRLACVASITASGIVALGSRLLATQPNMSVARTVWLECCLPICLVILRSLQDNDADVRAVSNAFAQSLLALQQQQQQPEVTAPIATVVHRTVDLLARWLVQGVGVSPPQVRKHARSYILHRAMQLLRDWITSEHSREMPALVVDQGGEGGGGGGGGGAASTPAAASRSGSSGGDVAAVVVEGVRAEAAANSTASMQARQRIFLAERDNWHIEAPVYVRVLVSGIIAPLLAQNHGEDEEDERQQFQCALLDVALDGLRFALPYIKVRQQVAAWERPAFGSTYTACIVAWECNRLDTTAVCPGALAEVRGRWKALHQLALTELARCGPATASTRLGMERMLRICADSCARSAAAGFHNEHVDVEGETGGDVVQLLETPSTWGC